MSQSQLKAESVSKNPFFQVLRQTYSELYSLAAKRGWKICVPHSTTISGATLNEHFFKSHILQSSPYFKEEYVTLNGQCVIYKNGIISTKTGFESPREVHVLGEELFYTQDFKSFTVYCISSPLIGLYEDQYQYLQQYHYAEQTPQHSSQHSYDKEEQQTILQIAIENRNERQCKKLLLLCLEPTVYKKMMEEIKSFAEQFNRSYVMIKGYTKAASKRIEEFRNNTFDQLILNPNAYSTPNSSTKYDKNKQRHKKKKAKNKTAKSSNHKTSYNKNELDELQASFDSYLNFILFDRIFHTFLVRHFKSADHLFSNQIKCLQSLTQETIGIKKQFQSKTSSFKLAIQQLSHLNDYKLAMHKLSVLKETFQLIRNCIETEKESHKQNTNKARFNKEEMALTTDDMLSLFTFVLIHSNIKYLLSNNEYLKYFYFQLHCTQHLSYYQSTLEASILYIQNQLLIPKYLNQSPKYENCSQNGSHFGFKAQ